MFVFNTTFIVKEKCIPAWEEWMDQSYYPLLKTLIPTSPVKTFEVMLASKAEEKTFSVQWPVVTPDELEELNRNSSMILATLPENFGSDALSFCSILRQVK